VYVKYFTTASNAIQGPVAVQVQEAIAGHKMCNGPHVFSYRLGLIH